jgi:hypothetical protein
MLKYEDKFIVADFDYGHYNFTPKLLLLTWSILSVSFLICIVPFLYYITMPNPFSNTIFRGSIFFILLIIIGFIYLPICTFKDKQLDRLIALALSDPDLVKRTVEPWVFSTTAGNPREGNRYRMGINFRVNSKKHMKIEKKYSTLYRRFENKEMEILYSPKYDQVLVLDSKQRI